MSTLRSGQFVWNIDSSTLQAMKAAPFGHKFISPSFEIARVFWRIESFPNGYTTDRSDTFELFLTLVSMPLSWKRIECCIRRQCLQTKGSSTCYNEYTKNTSHRSIAKAILFPEVLPLNTVSFVIEIMVNKIISTNEAILYERPVSFFGNHRENQIQNQSQNQIQNQIGNQNRKIHWNLDLQLLRYRNLFYDGKQLESPLLHGIWCLKLRRQSSYLEIWIQLCALPPRTEHLVAQCNMQLIWGGNNVNKQVTESRATDFYLERNTWPMISLDSHSFLQDLQQCDSMEIIMDITPQSNTNDVAGHYENELNENNIAPPNNMRNDDTVHPRFDSIDSRIDSVTADIVQLQRDVMNAKLKCTKIEQIESEMKSVQSQFDELQQRVSIIDEQLTTLQQQEDSEKDAVDIQVTRLNEVSQVKQVTQPLATLPSLASLDTNNALRSWMEYEVKLPYYQLLKDQGFEDLESVQDLTADELKEMGIKKIGHRKKIMKLIRQMNKCNDKNMEPDPWVITSEISKSNKLYETAIRNMMKCLIPQPSTSLLSIFDKKCNSLRKFVEKQYDQQYLALKAEKDVDRKYLSSIRKYIEMNESADRKYHRVMIGDAVEYQSEVIGKYEVSDHPRVPSLNGDHGLKSRVFIPKHTVIGDYPGKYWIEHHLDVLARTHLYNKINRYGFNGQVVVKIAMDQVRYYESSQCDDLNGDSDRGFNTDSNVDFHTEPPRKKRKKDEVKHTFRIVLDGHSVSSKGMLCFMNDCRSNMEVLEPTEEDEQYWNVAFVTGLFNLLMIQQKSVVFLW